MDFLKKLSFDALKPYLDPLSEKFFSLLSLISPPKSVDTTSHEIHQLAGKGDLKGLKIILSMKNPSFDLPDEKGDTPLFYAARNGHLDVIDFLNSQHVNVNHANIGGKTAIFYAVESSQLEAIDMLLKFGAQIDIIDAEGCSVVHHAILAGKEPALVYLAETKGAPLGQADRFEKSPLIMAAERQLLTSCQTLLAKGVLVDWTDQDGWTALMYATQKGHLEMMSVLIAAGASISVADRDFKQTPYLIACRNGYIEAMQLLLRHGANPEDCDYYSRNALHIAVEINKLDVVNFVLTTGINLKLKDRFGLTAQEWAVVNSSADVLKAVRDATESAKS